MNTPKKNKTPFYPAQKSKDRDAGLLVDKGGLLIDNTDEIFAGGITLDLRKIVR